MLTQGAPKEARTLFRRHLPPYALRKDQLVSIVWTCVGKVHARTDDIMELLSRLLFSLAAHDEWSIVVAITDGSERFRGHVGIGFRSQNLADVI
jgi:hypothetical protein